MTAECQTCGSAVLVDQTVEAVIVYRHRCEPNYRIIVKGAHPANKVFLRTDQADREVNV